MQIKEISKDIYNVSAMLDEVLGKEGLLFLPFLLYTE